MRFTPAITALAAIAISDFALGAPAPTPVSTPGSMPGDECAVAGSNPEQCPGYKPAPPVPSDDTPLKVSLTTKLTLADTAVDRFKLLPSNDDFIHDFNTQEQLNPGKGGKLVAANRVTFPALVGTGGGMAFGTVNACGLNTLHVHPRSAELQLVTKGRLITEMLPENGVLDGEGKRRVIRTELKKGQLTPFYQGSVHTQFNPDCETAEFVAAFSTEDFGTGSIADETFALSDDVLSATFGGSIAGEDLNKIRKAIPATIALGVEECLKKCNIRMK